MSYTLEEVSKHNTASDCWMVINSQVLNVTDFLNDHPGGAGVIKRVAGKDASKEFNMLHKPNTIENFAPECVIGKLKLVSNL